MVVLPEPLGPISPKISPRSTWKFTPFTAMRPPKFLLMSLTSKKFTCSTAVHRGYTLEIHRCFQLPLVSPLAQPVHWEDIVGVGQMPGPDELQSAELPLDNVSRQLVLIDFVIIRGESYRSEKRH